MKALIGRLRRLPAELARILLGGMLLAAALLLDGIPALILYILALFASGMGVAISAVRGLLRRDLLDEKFLMTVAAVGAFIIGEYAEGVAVMLFFLVGELFEHRAVARSRRSIRALMDIRPDRAILVTDAGDRELDADDVSVGDVIRIRPGERIPLDCAVLSGEALVDTSAVTGESVPIRATVGTRLSGGTVCLDGMLTASAERIAEDSAAARILALVESANEAKSKEETFIARFSHIYTPIVVGAALLLAVLVPLCLGGGAESFRVWVHRALIFLVVSCPCALVISVPLSFFGGIGGAASEGILFKGGNRMRAIANARVACFDKTGTLTQGTFSVREVLTAAPFDRDQILRLAAGAEYGSTHPIARAIRECCADAPLPTELHEHAGRGVLATVDGVRVAVGNRLLLREQGIEVPQADAAGAVFVALDGVYAGQIKVGDEVRSEAMRAIEALRSVGIRKTVMLTGDSEINARPITAALGIDDCYAGLLPEEKYRHLERLIRQGSGPVLFVGDGINDAPVLARADVGIAMGGIGSDAAIEAADAVILSDRLTRIPEAIRIARRTLRIATANIVFALGVKLSILILSAFGLNESMWLAVFADVGVAVIAILNAMRAMRVKHLRVEKTSGERNP